MFKAKTKPQKIATESSLYKALKFSHKMMKYGHAD